MAKTSRIALFAAAAVVTIGALTGSSQPSAAGSLNFLSNPGYVNCLKNSSIVANNQPAAQRGAMYDRLRRACNRGYFPNQPGVQY